MCRPRSASQTLNGNLPGMPSQSSLIGVVCFFSPIFSYFCLFVAAFKPCHGKLPLRKYIKTWPNDSKSSRRDCSERKGSFRSVDQRSAILTSTQMGVDAHVACRATQALSFTIRYMLLGFRITILFGHPEVDHVNDLMTSDGAKCRFFGERHLPLLPFVPGRPIKKLSGLMSR